MELSERDRRELAAIERAMAEQDPALARRLAASLPGRRRPRLPMSHAAALVAVLAVLCLAHAVVPDLPAIASAGLTAGLVGTWLLVTSRSLPAVAPARAQQDDPDLRRDDTEGRPPTWV